jgi:hypothetical protein
LQKADGSLLNFGKACSRSLRVWVQGLAFGLPLISLFTVDMAYRKLKRTGRTKWDKALSCVVIHKRIGPYRACVAALLICGIHAFIFAGRYSERDSAPIATSHNDTPLIEESRQPTVVAPDPIAQSAPPTVPPSRSIPVESQPTPKTVAHSESHPTDFEKLKMQAEQGDAVAQFNLGCAYSNGTDVTTDSVKAAKWWRKSADQGYDRSEYALGLAYANGDGVAQDDGEAARLFRRAAEKGNNLAQDDLALAINNGRGVVKDTSEAITWWRKAAVQGNPRAQMCLGSAYEDGSGVPQDLIEAYYWYGLSAAAGNADAGYDLTLLKAKMSASQILQAQVRLAGKR